MRLLLACLLAPVAALSAAAADLPDTYTTVDRDTLYAIADRPEIYGDHALWMALWEANKDVLPDPHAVAGGIVLKIPRDLSMLEILDYRRKAETYRREVKK
jgi:nucleoid-associated protein YgaU